VRRCYDCASTALHQVSASRCRVCNQTMATGQHRCTNRLCNDPHRCFEWTTAIAMKSGPLESAIWSHKQGQWGWGIVFSRVVLGFLRSHPETVQGLGAIIPTPSYRAPGTDIKFDHAAWVISQAADQDDAGFPFAFDPPLILKATPTGKMRTADGLTGRRALAGELYETLRVPEPGKVAGRHIMVFDDVFTTGGTLNAVARRLKESGAAGIYGLTLARQPWT
jgi:predicted amidophosphoribosyltransferase